MKIVKIAKGDEKNAVSYMNNRGEADFKEIDAAVAEIIRSVRDQGDAALATYIEKFEGSAPRTDAGGRLDIKVSQQEWDAAVASIKPDVLDALNVAADNIRSFHEKQVEKTWSYEKDDGVRLGQIVTPIENVGVYAPGGKAAYPSTVLMNVIPAVLAGVARIAVATPADADGKVNPVILAAARIAGASEVYKMGGAQSIAALAYGTKTVAPVDKITGPGNIYVARAKKMVFGTVDIDMIAGPSEICIISDSSSEPAYIAADLLAQAEHDEMACAVLVTDSAALAESVYTETERRLSTLDREGIARASIQNNCFLFVADDMDSCFDIANAIAPEHLEIMLPDPLRYMSRVKNAGAAFFGKYAPESLGDYLAGPNHTLPTSGTARFASPLGVYDFQKKTSIIYYPEEALNKCADTIITIAEEEGLFAHGETVAVRTGDHSERRK